MLDLCLYFTCSTNFGKTMHTMHCKQKVDEALSSLLGTFDMASCILADSGKILNEGTPPEDALPSLLRSDFGALDIAFVQHVTFDEKATTPVMSSLPHLVDTRSAACIVEQMVADSLFSVHLQSDGGEVLPKATVLRLLALYANCHSIKFLAARIHTSVICGGLAMNLKAETFDKKQSGLLLGLRQAVQQVRDILRSEAIQALEGRRHLLLYDGFWVGSWLDGVEAYFNKACMKFFEGLRAKISSIASDLEKELPRWEAWVTESEFNMD